MSESNYLWMPSHERRREANIAKFIGYINKKRGLNLHFYDDLYQWSVDKIDDFWAEMWDFVPIIASQPYKCVVNNLKDFFEVEWFPGARLNFAENLLRYRDNHTAIIFYGEDKVSRRMTYKELYDEVARLVKSFRDMGMQPGDCIVGYMPNMIETIVAMLAATSIGATWASCATDLGPQATIDRLSQIKPKILITVDGYYYKGKVFDSIPNIEKIVENIPSLQKVIVVPYANSNGNIKKIPNAVHYEQFIAHGRDIKITFEQLPFNHPVFIMFSSGTTGKPKCIVQGVGVLLNHLKELMLHTDLKRDDTMLYMTTCSWMMWNWLVSSLGVGATILLYDGNPSHPEISAIWDIIDKENVTFFGTSASYIHYIMAEKYSPLRYHKLTALRGILQTGSVLSNEGFKYVYSDIKKEIHFNSISGGTDINGCFAIGNPTLPVYAGELQRWGLGMKMNCYDERGTPVFDQTGELVCEIPIPSMPLYFWGDPNKEKYRNTYFNIFPNVWRHGDYVKVNSSTKGITFFGRSDALLKPSGVRIGTAEIYNQVEQLEEIADSLAIGQDWKGDQRIILFVKMREGYELNDALKTKIAKTLRENASPRHVPSLILETPAIPYTMNMKKVEIAVTNIIHCRAVSNRDALVNPEALDFYKSIVGQLSK
ncbi:acetoacetate--CoA ligase [Chloroflexota bacterium]